MKNTLLTLVFILCFCLSGGTQLHAQGNPDFPEVTYDQGKIIGSLPYGRHFFIVGSTKLPNGGRADAVKVKIWSTGRTAFNRNKKLKELNPNIVASILAGPPLDSAVWSADRTEDTNVYRLYMDKALDFSTEYMLEFSFSERVNFELTEEEKTSIMDKIRSRSLAIYNSKGGIGSSEIQEIINEEVTTYLASTDEYASFFDGGTTTQSNYGNLPISPVTLENLSRQIGKYSSQEQLIQFLQPELEAAKAQLAGLPEDSPDLEGAQGEVDALQAQLDQYQAAYDEASENLNAALLIVRSKLVETYSSYIITSPEELSVTELESIRIGTSFGGGMVGFNAFQDNSDIDVFGYTAMKFYLLPVDKRIAEPYLTGAFFVNRLSVLVGASVSGDLSYRGQVMERALGIYPIVGLSYDLNRYLSVDVGATLFKQNSISPLTGDSDIRIGPVIGVNFDGDLFNRFNSLFGGDTYKINPGG